MCNLIKCVCFNLTFCKNCNVDIKQMVLNINVLCLFVLNSYPLISHPRIGTSELVENVYELTVCKG
jgi:hypothetical protein